MTRVAKFLMTAAAATMSVAPAIAAPVNPAASLSVVDATRAASVSENESDLRGRNSGIFIALAAGIAIIVVIIILGGDKSDRPTSP